MIPHQKKLSFLRYFIFFALIINLSFSQTDEFDPLENSTTYNSSEVFENYQEKLYLTKSQIIYRKFVASALSSSKEIGIAVLPLDFKQNSGELSIFYSISNKNPNETNNDKKCLKLKMIDSCVFPIPDSVNSTIINIAFYCESEICMFKWRLNHIDEINLGYGVREYFEFFREEFENFNISVPAKENFSRIILSIEYKYIPQQFTQFKNDIIFSSGQPLKKHLTDRQIFILYSNDTKLCSDCNVSIIIFSPKYSVITVEALLFDDSINEIFIKETVTDFLFSQKNNAYIMNLNKTLTTTDDSVLIISFKSLSGTKKTLFVAADNEPAQMSQCQWNSTIVSEIYEEEDIYIQKQDLTNLGLKGNKFYLYVTGEINGLFMIHTNIHTQKFLPLHLGIIESGLIMNNEIINYEFQLWKTDDNQKMTLSATMSTGHLNIYGRKCEKFSTCKLITKSDIDNKVDIAYKVEQNGLNMLEITPNCIYENSHVCFYMFAIMGNSSSSKNSKYNLLLKRTENIVILMENVFHESHIEIFYSEVYKLIVEDHANPENEVTSVSFLINQDLIYFVSKDKICYDFTGIECDIKSGNSLYPAIYENDPNSKNASNLTGTYYMVILGTERSNVLIYPMVKRKGSDNYTVKLLEGKSFKSVLIQTAPCQFFKFHVSSETPILVEIHLETSVSHGIRLYVSNDGKIPGESNYFLSSHRNYLSFTHSSLENEKIYIISVEYNEKFGNIPDNKIDFSIMYSTEASIKHLEPNNLFFDYIDAGKIKKFIFFPSFDQTSIILSKNVISPPNSENFLKMSLSILMKDDKFIQHDSIENNIILNRTVLMEYCGNKEKIDECAFYINLENQYDQTVHYSLVLRYKDHCVKLIDGKEQAFLIEEEKEILMHYFPVSKEEHLDVFSYSYGINYDIFFKFYNNVNKTTTFEWPFGELINSNIKYIQRNNYYISFNNSVFNECWPNCVVLISLRVKNTEFKIKSSPFHKVHIMLSSKISDLIENKPNMFSIEGNSAKYFLYDLSHFLSKNQSSLMLDLTNFFGETHIFVTINNDDQDKTPSAESFDFFSYIPNLLISKSDIYNVKPDLLKNPHLFIAVLCMTTSCETSLNLNSASFPIKYLIHGRPSAVFIEKGETKKFEYFHYLDKPFKVKFNRDTGVGHLAIVPCPAEKNMTYDACIEAAQGNHFNAELNELWTSSLIVSRNDSSYCKNCAYIVLLTGISDIKGTMNVLLDDEFLYLQEGRKFSDEVAVEKSNFYMIKFPANEEIKIIMNIYSGSPELYISHLPYLDQKQYEIHVNRNNNSQLTVTFNPEIKDIDNKELNFHVYALVFGKEASRYSITYKTSESIIFLHEGLMEFDTLSPSKTNRYVFEIYHQVQRPTLSINMKNDATKTFKIDMFFRAQKNPYDTSNSLNNLILSKNDFVISETSIMILLMNATGHYEFHLTNLDLIDVLYSIIVNTQYISMIPFNSVLNQIIPVDRAIFYETYAPNKGFLMFDLLQCVGEVKLFVSDDYEQFKTAMFDEELQGSEGIPRINIKKVKEGMIYFSLYSTSNFNKHYVGKSLDNRNKGYFKLVTHFYDSPEEIPENKITPGDNGRIVYEYDFIHNKIKLTFEPIRCIGVCPEYLKKYLSISYYVMISPNENLLNVYGKCSILNYENIQINKTNYETVLIFDKSLDNSNRLDHLEYLLDNPHDVNYVSIKAKIQGYPGNNNESVFMFYEDIEIMKPPIKIEKVIYYGLTVVSICLVVLLILCGCYYYKNFKKLSESLNYEVKDVDNAGSIITTLNASIEMQPKRYHGLIEDASAV